VVEAKKEGETLTGVEHQSAKYVDGLPDELEPAMNGGLAFIYESTGTETRFTNRLDPEPAIRPVFSFQRPGSASPAGTGVCPTDSTTAPRSTAVCDQDLEGVVATKLGEPYGPGERAWVKRKNPAWPRYQSEREGTIRSRSRKAVPARRSAHAGQ
jgi:hypothetical protein